MGTVILDNTCFFWLLKHPNNVNQFTSEHLAKHFFSASPQLICHYYCGQFLEHQTDVFSVVFVKEQEEVIIL